MTIRVLHCPTTVGGNPQGLARAERELGLHSWSIAFERNYLRYDADEYLRTEKQSPVVTEIRRWRVLWQAIRNFDIIHFNAGQSILPEWLAQEESLREKHHWFTLRVYNFYASMLKLRDLPVLTRAGKGIVVTFQGDDARQGDFCKAHFKISPATEVEPGYYSRESDAHKRNKIAKFARYVDRIYALNPDLLHVLPAQAEFMPYSHLNLREWRVQNKQNLDLEVPVIIHAPSHRGVKGTHHILNVVSRLKKEGIALEFILVEGVSHLEARRIYERADLLIDQVLCGWYGGLAVEFMALGKPVICYIRQEDLRFVPEQMRKDLPVINATPGTLYDVVKTWLTRRKQELPELGHRSRAYVERWHDPLKAAARLKHEYELIMATKGASVEIKHDPP